MKIPRFVRTAFHCYSVLAVGTGCNPLYKNEKQKSYVLILMKLRPLYFFKPQALQVSAPPHPHRGPADVRHPLPGRHQAQEDLGGGARGVLPGAAQKSGQDFAPLLKRLEGVHGSPASL